MDSPAVTASPLIAAVLADRGGNHDANYNGRERHTTQGPTELVASRPGLPGHVVLWRRCDPSVLGTIWRCCRSDIMEACRINLGTIRAKAGWRPTKSCARVDRVSQSSMHSGRERIFSLSTIMAPVTLTKGRQQTYLRTTMQEHYQRGLAIVLETCYGESDGFVNSSGIRGMLRFCRQTLPFISI
jgi:hypothetical protein